MEQEDRLDRGFLNRRVRDEGFPGRDGRRAGENHGSGRRENPSDPEPGRLHHRNEYPTAKRNERGG